jgi:heme/copper-type cytochrome/quinol oxidase subunit 2
MNSQLSRIAELIKERQFNKARTELQKYLNQNPNDAYGWYLMSFAESSGEKQLNAIQKAASISPNNPKVRSRLEKLQSGDFSISRRPATRSRLPLLIAVVVVVIVLASVGAIYLLSNNRDQNQQLPTQVALATSIPTTLAPTAAATIAASPTPEATSGQVQSENSESNNLLGSLLQTFSSTQEAVEDDLPLTEEPLETAAVITATATSTPRPSATAAVTSAAPAVNTGDAAPLNETVDIGTGEMLIIQADRPGFDRIFELGGTAPEASAGQEWVLVEMLLICSGEDNCAPAESSIQAVGSTGTYAPESSLEIVPLFNDEAFFNGQVYGYLGFIVPENESDLRLVLNQGGTNYAFQLQYPDEEELIEEEPVEEIS